MAKHQSEKTENGCNKKLKIDRVCKIFTNASAATSSSVSSNTIDLRSGNTKVAVNKEVLASFPFFKGIIAIDKHRAFIDVSEGVPSNELQNFVDYLNFGTLNLTPENAVKFLQISQYFIFKVSALQYYHIIP